MKTTTEQQLRKIALGLTAVILVQLVWSGVNLLLATDPEPILPAAASLQLEDLRFGAALDAELSQELVTRPVFWRGREPFTPVAATEEKVKKKPRNAEIDGVTLQGVYSTGDTTGVIVSYKDERLRLEPDEEVAGWTFTSLSGDAATFTYGSDSKELLLEHALVAPAPKDKTEQTPRRKTDEAPGEKTEQTPKPQKSNKHDKTGG